jgi:hypothetical protein
LDGLSLNAGDRGAFSGAETSIILPLGDLENQARINSGVLQHVSQFHRFSELSFHVVNPRR